MLRLPSLHAPLLLPTVCTVAGIVVGRGWPLPLWSIAVLLAATAIGLLLAAKHLPTVQSVGVLVCFLLLGMLVAPGEEKHTPDGIWTEAVVASVPADRPKTLMADLLLPQTGERRRCYIWKDERSLTLTVGDALLVCLNDGQFVRWNGWQRGGNGLHHLSRFEHLRIKALKWRSELTQRLHATQGNAEAEAVVAAMALGDKSGLTSELRDTYAQSGASHVLALSGLHLSIIYMLLTLLTLGRRRSWLPQVLVVLAIWAFALLTGLSTSVLRAAIMLTIYSLFVLGGRQNAPLGVLSFTALLMLLVDSRSLFDIGFQLSFMAMLGILLFMPLFRQWMSASWLMNHQMVKWLLGLMAVSMAAQLGTAPLVLYHFGRFPTWFLLTNMVVIPFATIILYATIIALIIPAFTVPLLWLTERLNLLLGWISHLPLSSIEAHPSVLQVVMMYVVVGVLYVTLAVYGRLRPTET